MTLTRETIQNITITFHILTLLTIIVLSVLTLTRLKSEKREYIVLFFFAGFISILGSVFDIMATTVETAMVGTKMVYLGGMFIGPLLLLFTQQYTEINLPKIINALLLIYAAAAVVTVWTTEQHGLFYSSVYIHAPGTSPDLYNWGFANGILYPVIAGQPVVCLAFALILFIIKAKRAEKGTRKKLMLLLLYISAPGIAQVLTLLGLDFFGVYYIILFVAVSGILAYVGIFKYDLLDNEEAIRSIHRLHEMAANIKELTDKGYEINLALDLAETRAVAEYIPETLERGNLKLDLYSNRAFIDGKDLSLTRKDFDILFLLFLNEDEVLSSEHIYEKIWAGPMLGDKNAIHTAISKLRKKITHSEYDIMTVYGKGYIFKRQ